MLALTDYEPHPNSYDLDCDLDLETQPSPRPCPSHRSDPTLDPDHDPVLRLNNPEVVIQTLGLTLIP